MTTKEVRLQSIATDWYLIDSVELCNLFLLSFFSFSLLCIMNINHAFAEASDEISFMPGDIITGVEMVDEGWWKGTCHGRTGLFPATFVELN